MKKAKTITNQQAEKLKNRLEARDKLLVQLAIESGLRISDILKLRVGDIKKTMTVYESKSKRERTFRLSDELYAELKKSVKYKRRASILFQGAQGASKPLHRSTIHRHIKKALRGQNFDASAHSMRKLYAHMVFNNTHDITAVQAALNHKNIITTCAYLDIDVQKLIIMSQEGNK